MRLCRIVSRGLAIAASVALVAATAPAASAQTVVSPPLDAPPSVMPMTMSEFSGLACIGTGIVAGVAALGYVEPVTMAATGLEVPILMAPVIAAAFAVGCSVGGSVAPGLLWIYRSKRL